MTAVQIVFSPTGGTLAAAGVLTQALGMDTRTIDLTDRRAGFAEEKPGPDELAVIAVPSYGGRVPAAAAQRLAQIRPQGTKCVLMAVYGNREFEDTLIELGDIAEKCGFEIIAAAAVIAEHSIARQYAAGRPDARDAETLRGFAGKILEKLSAPDAAAPALPGNRPYKKGGAGGLTPKADSRCTGCGQCARSCPVGAISENELKDADKKLCISCMRCVQVCPASARKVSSAALAGVSLMLKAVCSERKEPQLFI